MRFRTPRTPRRLTVVTLLAATLPPSLIAAVPAAATTAAAATTTAATTTAEERRVDVVPTPDLDWYDCYGEDAECATARLPVDYDEPRGAKVGVSMARLRASDPSQRIGTLFVNPGGPGESAVFAALSAHDYLPRAITRRFDVVGVDPRGQALSDNVACFGTRAKQDAVLGPLRVAFPDDPEQEQATVAAAQAMGRACSGSSARLTAAVSTTEVARDLDVLRRAVGDSHLTYLGFSYGTYLGTVYANLFPDRVRALALDGVVDPEAWRGTEETRDVPQTDRLRSGDAAWRAMRELLVRCGAAGPSRCRLAALTDDPLAAFSAAMTRLRRAPLTVTVEGRQVPLAHADVVRMLMEDLYDPTAADLVDTVLAQLWTLTSPDASAARRREARHVLAGIWAGHTLRPSAPGERYRKQAPSDASLEGYASVLCSDGRNPDDAQAWADAAPAVAERAPEFGLPWLWSSAPCAESTWTAHDEDVWTGPFTARTAAPVLVVGGLWDPATSYEGAQRLADLLPGARLLTSDSWGHTSFGTSTCVSDAVARYLVAGRLPARGTTCTGDVQPFAGLTPSGLPVAPLASSGAAESPAGSPEREWDDGRPAPVVPLLPFGSSRR